MQHEHSNIPSALGFSTGLRPLTPLEAFEAGRVFHSNVEGIIRGSCPLCGQVRCYVFNVHYGHFGEPPKGRSRALWFTAFVCFGCDSQPMGLFPAPETDVPTAPRTSPKETPR